MKEDNNNIKINKIQSLFWKILFFSYVILIIYLSIAQPVINYSTYRGEDKIVHFVSYFIGADLFFTAFYKKSNKFYFAINLIFFLVIPILTEYLQKFTYYRTYSVLDMLANYIGALVGFLFFLFKYRAFN
ncbi:hypothetical protein PW5551_02290 [Petrotoga sp. 9PW.55.5.1]|uniref:VanZ family protein n=1 Tax=Petrotoga sp. 9PW.55.5.1 TaxID=1308979 RepID=UPI000DC394F6|nr:VanZ family protein [Petrotoga sp. 9PW.55.5.1]RAO99691.1 hypothetical protein PW5551_02290 [Petrotoga sp. 9PW.55.5.1]